MKITKSQLKQIIKEEITKVLVETAQVPVPNVEDLLKKFKEDPSTYNDYYNIAQGETPEELGRGFPPWLDQEFAARMLAEVKSYILKNNLLEDFWGAVDSDKDHPLNNLKLRKIWLKEEHPLGVIESYIAPKSAVSAIKDYMSAFGPKPGDLEEIERRKGRIKK